jgi:hypothetical protein
LLVDLKENKDLFTFTQGIKIIKIDKIIEISRGISSVKNKESFKNTLRYIMIKVWPSVRQRGTKFINFKAILVIFAECIDGIE